MIAWWVRKLRGFGLVIAVFYFGSQSSAYGLGSNSLAPLSSVPGERISLFTKAIHETNHQSVLQTEQTPLAIDEINSKAEGLYLNGMKPRAIQLWARILEDYPGFLPAKYNLATAYFNNRQFKNAAELFFQIIEDDAVLWNYPEARFLGPLAYYRQFATIEDLHGGYLEQYLASGDSAFRVRAEALRLLAVDRIASESLIGGTTGSIKQQLAKSKRSIVHFWAEWCNPCIKELQQLFRFSIENPKINHVVVSVDAESDKGRADRRVNNLFSPYKAHRTNNIRFIHDARRELWKMFVPQKDQQTRTVPRTVFLRGMNLVGYSPQQVSWETLDLVTIWSE